MAGTRPTAVSCTANSPKAAADKSAFTSRVKSSRDFGPAIEKPVRVEATERTKTSAGRPQYPKQRRGKSPGKPEPTNRKGDTGRQANRRAPDSAPARLGGRGGRGAPAGG